MPGTPAQPSTPVPEGTEAAPPLAAARGLMPEATAEACREHLRTMFRIRAFEEKVDELFMQGVIHGTTHLSIGQEAVATGAMAALEPEDYITSTHRGHGHCIAKGAELDPMMAELLGKETGYCRGRGGSMHIADVARGNLGANGVVGGGIPVATGVGLSLQMQRRPQVCVCFFGDGASNEGTFHEAINLAAVWNLPVIYLCENNQYGMSMSVRRSTHVASIADRAAAYGIPGESVDGNDLFDVREAVARAVTRARAGEGPTLIEARTYRYKGHSKSDQNRYRTRAEIDEWRRRDPIGRLEALATEAGLLTEADVQAERERAYAEIEDAYRYALASPDPRPEQLLEGVYA